MLEYFGVDPQMQTFLAVMSMQPEFAIGGLDSVLARTAGSTAETTAVRTNYRAYEVLSEQLVCQPGLFH
jgi:hypothetical protein